MPVKIIIYEKSGSEQAASRVQTKHLVYKTGILFTKVAFRLQICTFQFTNKHLVLQTGVSDYNSAIGITELLSYSLIIQYIRLYIKETMTEMSTEFKVLNIEKQGLGLHI